MFGPDIKILVVDDMIAMRKLVVKLCRELGFHNFSEADDGAVAWEAINKESSQFSLIISDWNMPNCSGMELLKQVRSDARFKDLPFLMVTAESESDQIAEAISNGVSNYIIKPFSAAGLKEKLLQVSQKKTGPT